MEQSALAPLAGWESFYVIVGSAAAALTGLQFVVIVLGVEKDSVISLIRHTRRQTAYVPVFSDWLWYSVIPLVGYAMLSIAAAFLNQDSARSLFAIGGASILLLFVGIHNAWDAVTYIAHKGAKEKAKEKRSHRGRG